MIARMQPVSWLVIGLLVMFAGLTISNRRERAAGQVGQPMSTMAVAMVGVSQQQATRTPRPSATPRPTRTLRPTADATAVFFKRLDARQTIAVRTATAEARATQAIATFTPAPPTPTIYPAGYRAPWADKMVKQADGTWMAPKEVGEAVIADYTRYLNWRISGRNLKSIQAPFGERAIELRKYLVGLSLQAHLNDSPENRYDYLARQDSRPTFKILRVRFSSGNGGIAVCDVEVRGFRWDIYDIQSGKRVTTLDEPDGTETIELIFDPVDSKWKLSRGITLVPYK
jgi:hypothetical protein